MLSSGDPTMRSLNSHHAPIAKNKAARVRIVASIVVQSKCEDHLLDVEGGFIPLSELSPQSFYGGSLCQGQQMRPETKHACENGLKCP